MVISKHHTCIILWKVHIMNGNFLTENVIQGRKRKTRSVNGISISSERVSLFNELVQFPFSKERQSTNPREFTLTFLGRTKVIIITLACRNTSNHIERVKQNQERYIIFFFFFVVVFFFFKFYFIFKLYIIVLVLPNIINCEVWFNVSLMILLGFPGGSVAKKKSPCQCRWHRI